MLGCFPPTFKKLFFFFLSFLLVLTLKRGRSPPPAPGGLGARCSFTVTVLTVPPAHTVQVTRDGRRKWLSHLWEKKKAPHSSAFQSKRAKAPVAGGSRLFLFYKKAETPVAKRRITCGQEEGVGAASPPPGVFGKASPQIQVGRGTGGGVSPHQAPETATETASGSPPPARPPNIQVFKNREGKSTDVFKKLTKQDEQLEARGLSRPWPAMETWPDPRPTLPWRGAIGTLPGRQKRVCVEKGACIA